MALFWVNTVFHSLCSHSFAFCHPAPFSVFVVGPLFLLASSAVFSASVFSDPAHPSPLESQAETSLLSLQQCCANVEQGPQELPLQKQVGESDVSYEIPCFAWGTTVQSLSPSSLKWQPLSRLARKSFSILCLLIFIVLLGCCLNLELAHSVLINHSFFLLGRSMYWPDLHCSWYLQLATIKVQTTNVRWGLELRANEWFGIPHRCPWNGQGSLSKCLTFLLRGHMCKNALIFYFLFLFWFSIHSIHVVFSGSITIVLFFLLLLLLLFFTFSPLFLFLPLPFLFLLSPSLLLLLLPPSLLLLLPKPLFFFLLLGFLCL